jgi:adenylate kinase
MIADSAQQVRFVNRFEELDQIRKKLEAIKSQKLLFEFILTISGIPGIGKTTLLNQAEQKAEALGIQTVWVDYENGAAKNNPLYMLQKVADQLFKTALNWQKALKTYRDNQEILSQSDNIEPVIRTFVENLRMHLERIPFLFLIDNGHWMDETAQVVFEDVLERLYPYNRLVVIIAGRSDIRWRSFELRQRTEPIPLTSFPKTETAKLLPDPGYAMLNDYVYALTQGYPIASVLAYQWVEDNFEPSNLNLSDQFKAREAELIFNLFDAIFEKYILGNINPEIRQRLGQLLRYVSPLRRFDDNLLAALLREIDKDNFGQTNTLNTRVYSRQMVAQTYLVKWESGKQAYALDRPMRHLLSLEMKFRERSRLVKIHQFVMDWYQRAISEVTAKDPSAPQSVIYLIEHIYHYVQLQQFKPKPVDLEIVLQQKIMTLFVGYKMSERVHFQEEFNKDEDLPELLGDVYPRLTDFVVQRVDWEGQK